MDKKLVSVVLCTYNGERFLEEQVESILRQTYHPLELIISDDHSQDGTVALLEKYKGRDGISVFFQEKNIGLTRNFEFAALQTKGELIAFSDQDDIWLDNKIEQLVVAIGDKPLVYSDSLLVDEQGNSINKKLSDLKKMYSGTDSRGYILYSCVWGHGMLITKDLFEKSLPMPVEIHHDIWITFKAFMNGGIVYFDKVLTYYRQHASSTSTTLPVKKKTSPLHERYKAYKEKLHWIELMQQNERVEFQPFYEKLLKLYRQKGEGKYVFELIPFMLKYRAAFFMFSKKSFISQLVEIIKQARGEKAN
jgi:glycosyltransferase involved in cell wall biosynthesis